MTEHFDTRDIALEADDADNASTAQDTLRLVGETVDPGLMPAIRPAPVVKIMTAGRPGAGALVINLFGGPGVGKSTMASRIFSALKELDVEAAAPEEHAKTAIWTGQSWLLRHQTIMLGKTLETVLTLRDKVDVIVIDSPILLCSVYAAPDEPDAFHALCVESHKRFDRVNIMIEREDGARYTRRGREQDLDGAIAMDRRIRERLQSADEDWTTISRDKTNARRIARAIRAHIDAQNE